MSAEDFIIAHLSESHKKKGPNNLLVTMTGQTYFCEFWDFTVCTQGFPDTSIDNSDDLFTI